MGTKPQKRAQHVMTVWLGYTDGEPHKFDMFGVVQYAVFATRKTAASQYEDVRKAQIRVLKPRAV